MTVLPDVAAQEAVQLLDRHVVTSLPVVNTEGRPVGIIGDADLIGPVARGEHGVIKKRHSRNAAGAGVRSDPAAAGEGWLVRVVELASRDAGGVSGEYLGEYLPMLAAAATCGQSPSGAQIRAVRNQGHRAAQQGVSVGQGVDLYLSAARRVWSELPAVIRRRNNTAVRAAAAAVLRVVDDAVASFAEGHAEAGREMIRREETLRRDLIEDLLRGDAHLSELVERAEPFGLDLTRAHQVALAQPGQRIPSIAAATSALERVVLDRFGDRDVLVATKEGLVVVLALAVAPGAPTSSRSSGTDGDLGKILHGELSRLRRGSPWRVAVGRAHPGAYGIARSYEEAREALTMASRMNLDRPIVETRDLLTYRVLSRDQPALVELVYSVLNPLGEARGGAAPLVQTLATYFECGCVATAAANTLHLSVRAVTYRLERIKSLTGFDPLDPAHRYTLQTAVLGARVLGWPERPLPDPADWP
ncbi:helix-turn-helix domain-containing protein [Nocardioides sp.]|uniref:helix-turn-helix domain-containing protein n=1 Tax=Nocardioides sp. TaxID=35761 RepID=UPI002F40C625